MCCYMFAITLYFDNTYFNSLFRLVLIMKPKKGLNKLNQAKPFLGFNSLLLWFCLQTWLLQT